MFSQAEVIRELPGSHGILFGDTEEKTIDAMKVIGFPEPSRRFQREDYIALEYRFFENKPDGVDLLKIFIHPECGVYRIDEEHFFRWDLQSEYKENEVALQLKYHQLAKKLKNKFGDPILLTDPFIQPEYTDPPSITGAWQFRNHRWVHLLVEKQNWEIFPELVKIVVMVRASDLRP